MLGRALATTLLGLLLLAAPAPAESSATSTVIVLDVSNSMWGQVEGRAKIEIAREVIGELMRDWDPAVELGLVAYGHRREGDCSDIETVIPVGPVDPARFAATVNGLVPRGKTPLTAAVRQAAEILNYRDVPATVVLVSDGIESCQADPCALAKELEAAGIDFTAHVVGFDVAKAEDRAQLSCIAENTGGRFFSASTASELKTALASVSAPAGPKIALEAVEAAGGPALTDPGLRWTVVDLVSEKTVLADSAEARPELALGPGRYAAHAVLGARAGTTEFELAGGESKALQVVLTAAVSLSPPAEAEANSAVEVPWQGPNGAGDYLAVTAPGDPDTAFLTYVRTGNGNPARLQLPDAPGDYEIRYVEARSRKVLARAPIRVGGPSASVEAPESVDAGAGLAVGWQGPDEAGDFVTVVAPDAPAGTFGALARTADGNPAMLTAPAAPGSYEVRYVSARTQATLARAPLVVVLSAKLEAPPAVDIGAVFKVAWSGPDNQGDYITIAALDAPAGTYTNYTYTAKGSPLELRALDVPGEYELRYVSAADDATLASLPLTINAVAAKLEAPPAAGAGSEVQVTWTGPDNQGDFITVVPAGEVEGKYGNYTYTAKGSPLTLRLPDKPGNYELRYVLSQSNATLASLPITASEVQASLEAPPAAGAGAEVKVAWKGPDNKGDFITVVPVGEAEGQYGNYTYTAKGSPLALRLPDQPGAYELRYVQAQSRATLASLPLTINAVAASLEAPPAAGAGSEVQVAWKGPDNKGDYITVVPAGEAEGQHGNYTYTAKGSPLTLRLPDEPGRYELRYVLAQSRATLASLPITASDVSASLEAPPSAEAGAKLQLTWTGPNNRGDYITVVPVGAAAGQHGPYVYTQKGPPATLLLPKETGQYELRYVTGQSRHTLATLPLTVK